MTDGAPEPPARRRSFAGTAAAAYGTNLAAAGLSLVNVLIVSRALGPAGRGDVVFLMTVALLTASVAALGVQEANANLGVERGLRRALAANSLVLAAVLGVAAAVVVLALVAVFPAVGGDATRPLLLLALAAIPVLLGKQYLMFLIQAEYGFAVTNAAWLLGPLTSTTVNAVLAATGAITVGTAVAAWFGGQILGAALLCWYVATRTGFARPSPSLAGRSLGFGLKTHAGRFMALGNYRVDQWFLGAMSGSRELGLYSIAVAWAEMLFYLSGVLVMIQRPDVVRAAPDEAARLTARVVRVALLVAIPAAIVLVAAAPILCVTLMGAEFEGSIDDLRILALGAFGVVALDLISNSLNAQRRPLRGAVAIGIAFVVTLTLDLALIPRFGGAGAAVATTAAWTVGAVAAIVLFTRALPSTPRDFVPRPAELPWLWRKLRGSAAG
jgi:O-antigen/teichoic acid export membrane protein